MPIAKRGDTISQPPSLKNFMRIFPRVGRAKRSVQKATASGKVVTVKEYFPPSDSAIQFWLRHQKPEPYREQKDVNVKHNVEHGRETTRNLRHHSSGLLIDPERLGHLPIDQASRYQRLHDGNKVSFVLGWLTALGGAPSPSQSSPS